MKAPGVSNSRLLANLSYNGTGRRLGGVPYTCQLVSPEGMIAGAIRKPRPATSQWPHKEHSRCETWWRNVIPTGRGIRDMAWRVRSAVPAGLKLSGVRNPPMNRVGYFLSPVRAWEWGGKAKPGREPRNYLPVKLSARATAVSMALALFTVSSNSPSGVESLTQPPPAWT
jgi:hypothetical protein